MFGKRFLPGRPIPQSVEGNHPVLGVPVGQRAKADSAIVLFGMGCFWGAERRFWQQPGVLRTAVGYAGGETPNPTYEEVCSGQTGHTEVVLVEYDPQLIGFAHLLRVFWESHDPCQGMRQGNDIGTQYRSAIYCTTDEQWAQAHASQAAFAGALQAAGDRRPITTELARDRPFYFAEPYHQQYLHYRPWGYCGLAGTGVCLPTA